MTWKRKSEINVIKARAGRRRRRKKNVEEVEQDNESDDEKSKLKRKKSRKGEKEKAKEDISDDEAGQDAVDDDDDDGRIKRYNTNIRTKSNTSGGMTGFVSKILTTPIFTKGLRVPQQKQIAGDLESNFSMRTPFLLSRSTGQTN